MNRELTELESAKTELDGDLAKLKAEYAAMIYTSSKRNNTLNSLSFLFSAASFNQFWVRYKYLRQYSDERQKQVTQMKKVQQLMADKTYRITGKKTDQQKALTSKIDETKNLEVLKTKKSAVVTELSQREKELKTEMAEIRKENQRIESTLTNIIRREIQERRNREARDKAIRQRVERERIARERADAKKTEAEKVEDKKEEAATVKVEPKPEAVPNSDGMNEAEVAIASSFSASKGRMLWPVRSGFISSRFGTKINAELGLPQPNDGVDIQTKTGEAVHTVYDGTVVEVSFEALSKNVVYIQHGNYYTVYTKLKNVSVRKGQKIKARDTIGTVATDSDGTSEINFQVWKDFDKLNPEKWLSPR
jgi:septal ring factor EnvC (AmiA/AmiB activator)